MNKTKALPKRSEIPQEAKWKLEDIYASDQDWEKDVQQAKSLIEQVQAHQGTLAESGKNLLHETK